MPTFLDGWAAAQNWVSDMRPRTKSWADSVASRIKELKLERGKIGMDGLAGPLDPDGWLPHDVYKQLVALLPDASIAGLDDMLDLSVLELNMRRIGRGRDGPATMSELSAGTQ